MKKLLFICVISILTIPAFANINGNGYYRVKNYGSQRWASLIDNQGSVDIHAFAANLHAFYLSNNTDSILFDPGSIIYLKNITRYQYDVAAQGTSLQSLTDIPINIMQDGTADGQALYRIYGTKSGTTAYISDGRANKTSPTGKAAISRDPEGQLANYAKWEIIPVNNTDNYFGTVPTLTVGGKQYTTLFTSFAYKPNSSNVKAYYIGRVGFGMAEMIEITGGVPAASPVIIQCAGSKAADNKMQLLSSQDALPDNSLSGVYFNYSDSEYKNYVTYNSSTMRVLGVCSDGSLGFVTAKSLPNGRIPRNTAYLKVPAGAPAEFKCVTTAEFEANLPVQPEQFSAGNGQYILQPQDDYNYTGIFDIPAQSNLSFQFTSSVNNGSNILVGPAGSNGKNVTISINNNVPFEYGNNASWVIPQWKGGKLHITLNLQYQYVSFSDGTSSINTITVTDSNLRYDGFSIVSAASEAIKIVDLSGRIVAQGVGSIDVSDLGKGIYVAISGKDSLKFFRK
ncbi:MAG: hypothetical protein J1F38_06915 [Muribaculaceae bacterium]|nr:hypothetical protein [Muribaculaceae bacterium]